MTQPEFAAFVAQVQQRGFNHVETLAGPLDLAEWRPYGVFDGTNMEQHLAGFEWVSENQVADILTSPRLGNYISRGVWTFTAA